MKITYFAGSRFRVIRQTAFAVCFTGLAAFSGCDYVSDVLDEIEDGEKEELSLEEYFEQINQILYSDTAQVEYSTAKEAIQAQADRYQEQYKEASAIKPPDEVAEVHIDLVQALKDQATSNEEAAENTPEDLSVTNENVNGYAHYYAAVGYARNDQAGAGCELESIADSNGIAFNALGVCEAFTPEVPNGKSIGTAEEPVKEIYILHETVESPDAELDIPNVYGFEYDSITAKAGEPIKITFDNRNPAPFVFNIAIYKRNDERVTSEQYVAGTLAYAGEKVHELTVTLEPGIYTYVDNVHPVAVRGTLTVVE